MTTKDYQKKSPIAIFLHYFSNHKGLFALDILCAMLIAGIDLMFPLVTRTALNEWLPNKLYGVFFTVMAVVGVPEMDETMSPSTAAPSVSR